MTKKISQLTAGTPAIGDKFEFETAGGVSKHCDFADVGKPNRAFTNTLVNASSTATIPVDNTVPQVTEGAEVLSLSITPTSASARIRVEATIIAALNRAGEWAIAALFINGASNAVSANQFIASAIGDGGEITLIYEYVPGSTSVQTISARCGPMGGSTGTVTFNTLSTSVTLGGVIKSSMRAFEI